MCGDIGTLIVAVNPRQIGSQAQHFSLVAVPFVVVLSLGYYLLQGVRWHFLLASEKAGFAPTPLAGFIAPHSPIEVVGYISPELQTDYAVNVTVSATMIKYFPSFEEPEYVNPVVGK